MPWVVKLRVLGVPSSTAERAFAFAREAEVLQAETEPLLPRAVLVEDPGGDPVPPFVWRRWGEVIAAGGSCPPVSDAEDEELDALYRAHPGDWSDVRAYPGDCVRLCGLLEAAGHPATLRAAADLWGRRSAMWDASWLTVGERGDAEVKDDLLRTMRGEVW